jgi:hypothetical protein
MSTRDELLLALTNLNRWRLIPAVLLCVASGRAAHSWVAANWEPDEGKFE